MAKCKDLTRSTEKGLIVHLLHISVLPVFVLLANLTIRASLAVVAAAAAAGVVGRHDNREV